MHGVQMRALVLPMVAVATLSIYSIYLLAMLPYFELGDSEKYPQFRQILNIQIGVIGVQWIIACVITLIL